MKRILCWVLLSLVVCAMAVGRLQAAGQSLPPAIAGLTPTGATMSSPTYAKTPTFANAEFTAEKKLPGNHAAYYKFHLLCSDTSSRLWSMQEPIYRADTQSKIDQKRKSFETGSNPPVSYDAVKETKYAWGTGFTQRVVHHYMGEGTGPDYVDYRTAYVGMIGGATFELTADGVPTADEADQWAKTVAEKAGTISFANLGS